MTAINTRDMPLGIWRLSPDFYLQPYHSSETQTKIPSLKPASRGAADSEVAPRAVSLELRLFDNASDLKIAMSKFAMHLADHWRTSIRQQLDVLLSIASWEDESSFITNSSFQTFLRFILHARPKALPSLGVGHTGHLLASWRTQEINASIEFLPDGTAIAILILPTERNRPELRDEEVLTWQGRVENLKSFLDRNHALGCLDS